MRYSTRTEITADILKAALDGGNRTRIQYGASLAYSQFENYIVDLTSIGLLEYSEKDKIYRATPKGLEFLQSKKIN